MTEQQPDDVPNSAASGQDIPTIVGPMGPVGQTTGAFFSGASAAPVAFPDPVHRPYPEPRPAGSAISAFSAVRTDAGLTDSELGTLMETLGMEVTQRDAQCTHVRMPVEGALQVAGMLHGGATAALIETAASVAAREAAPSGSVPVGAELTVSHLRPVYQGWVTAVATPVHVGRRTALYDVAVNDDEGRQVARGSLRSLFT